MSLDEVLDDGQDHLGRVDVEVVVALQLPVDDRTCATVLYLRRNEKDNFQLPLAGQLCASVLYLIKRRWWLPSSSLWQDSFVLASFI